MWRTLILSASILAMLGIVGGCSKPDGECQSGAKTATEAVDLLVRAAVENDLELACRVTTNLSNEELDANLAEIRGFVSAVGGIGAVSAIERPDERLGGAYFVDLQVTDSTASLKFMLGRHDGMYLVDVPDEGTVRDGPTTSPEDPPEGEQKEPRTT
jgi:hypothetical protein